MIGSKTHCGGPALADPLQVPRILSHPTVLVSFVTASSITSLRFQHDRRVSRNTPLLLIRESAPGTAVPRIFARPEQLPDVVRGRRREWFGHDFPKHVAPQVDDQ